MKWAHYTFLSLLYIGSHVFLIPWLLWLLESFGLLMGALILLLGVAGLILLYKLNQFRNRLGPSSPDDQELLDGPALVDMARRITNVLVVFESVHADNAQRVALYSQTGPRLGAPIFVWIAGRCSADCRVRLRAVGLRTAQADSHPFGSWHSIHTDDDQPMSLWTSRMSGPVRELWRPRRIRCALMEVDGFWVVHFDGRRRAIKAGAIVGVEAWAGEDLLCHELRLQVATDDGIETVTVARRYVSLLSNYDEWDSPEDWAKLWVGGALAKRLELPLTHSGELN